MKSIYASPLRVYLALGLLSLAGVWSGLSLPTSLFPNSSKPKIGVYFNLSGLTPAKFMQDYGYELEVALGAISRTPVIAERVVTSLNAEGGSIEVEFKWGTPALDAVREVQSVANAYAARMPDEVRRTINVWQRQSNSGFFAASISSKTRSMDEVHDIVAPLLNPKLARIEDANHPELYNPNQKETLIELDSQRLTALGIMPRAVDAAVRSAMVGMGAGMLRTESGSSVAIVIPRQLIGLKELRELPVRSQSGKSFHLGDFSHIDHGLPENARQIFRTSGVPSQILWAQPKPDGNIKKMSEDLLVALDEVKKLVPQDIEFKVLVDPSRFIRASVNNVFKEVILGATLAVLVLFIFIGSLKNVVTAAIEIPLSMVLAFILMRWSGMNLNMISLGGLALSAGMNVDASVVVMENIFRHFDLWREKNHERVQNQQEPTFAEKLELVTLAVKEVRFSVIASTIASLVVFAPLAFTSGLSYAVLGDLAKTVVYSHGFSAIVALILVPTVRLQLMKKRVDYPHSRFEPQIDWISTAYARLLRIFLTRAKVRIGAYFGALALLAVLLGWVLPGLPKEVIGTADTDWVYIGIGMKGNQVTRQADEQVQKIDGKLREKFSDQIDFTLAQVNSVDWGMILAHLKNKKEMSTVTPLLEAEFKDSATIKVNLGPWNPAEMSLPDPAEMHLVLRGGGNMSLRELAPAAQSLTDYLKGQKLFSRIWAKPDTASSETIVLTANPNVVALSGQGGVALAPVLADLADLLYVATLGRRLGSLEVEGHNSNIFMRFKKGEVESFEDVANYPVQLAGKIVPLRALMTTTAEKQVLGVYREEGLDQVSVLGKNYGGGKKLPAAQPVATNQELEKKIEAWRGLNSELSKGISVLIEDPQKDLNTALFQLATATGLSVLLIFVIMVIQFGDIMSALLVLVAIPLGLIGVLLALFVAGSTLSLNSVLGVILLNGISVANSIILVDFIRRRVADGLSPLHAAIDAGKQRLRPILITSLTTVLGMLPIALGFGEGGKILQPLGIAVSGGLWISMMLTLFFVPALQVSWLEYQAKRGERNDQRRSGERGQNLGDKTVSALVLCVLFFCGGEVHAQESAKAMPFMDALRLGLSRSPELEQARIAVQSSRARVVGQAMSFGPTLGVETLLAGTTRANYPDGSRVSQSSASWSGSAGLSLFRFGRDWFSLQGLRSDFEASEHQVLAKHLTLEAVIVQALLNGQSRVRAKASVEQTVSNLEQLLKFAELRFKKGLLALQEVQKIQIDLENAKARLASTQLGVLEVQRELEQILGEDVVLEQDWPLRSAIMNGTGEQLLPQDTAFSERPDWLAAMAQLDSAKQSARAAVSTYFPSLGWSGSLSQSNSTFGNWSTRPEVWSTSLTATWNFWDGGSTYTTHRLQGFAVDQREQALLALERQIKADWRVVRQQYEIQKSAALAREKVLGVAGQLYQDSLKRFELGRTSSNDLFVEQSRLLDAQLNSIESWNQAHLAYLKLLHSKGQSLVRASSID